MTEAEFRQKLQEQGYGEPMPMEYAPRLDKPMHTHEQSAMGLVVSGEFILKLEDGRKSYQPGEWCELPAGTVHTESAGGDGANALMAFK